MKWHRIQTSVLHSYYHLMHSLETWVDLLWFSLVDVTTFCFLAKFFLTTSSYAQYLVISIVLWQVVRVGQYTTSVGMLWEIWSKSFSSLFVSPLSIWEFIIGQMLSGILKSIGVMVVVGLVAGVGFGFSLSMIGWWIVPFFFILYVFAAGFGLFINGLIIRYGVSIQSLAWGLIFLFQPFSAVYFPITVLPDWIQWVSWMEPITYIMEAAHLIAQGKEFPMQWLWMSIGLTIFWSTGGALYFHSMVQRSKRMGTFARMGN